MKNKKMFLKLSVLLIISSLMCLGCISCYTTYKTELAKTNLAKANECLEFLNEKYSEKMVPKYYPRGFYDHFVARFSPEGGPDLNFAVWHNGESRFYDEYLTDNLIYEAKQAISDMLTELGFYNAKISILSFYSPNPSVIQDCLYYEYYIPNGQAPQLSDISKRKDIIFGDVTVYMDTEEDLKMAQEVELEKRINDILTTNTVIVQLKSANTVK